MNFGIYSYIVTTLIFCGSALLLYVATRKRLAGKNNALTKHDWNAIAWTVLIMVVLASPEESTAFAWRVWAYTPERTLHTIFFGAELESYLYIGFVTLVVSIATLLYARREDRKFSRQ